MPHKARKRFGQNFLHDQNVISNIVTAIHPTPDQSIIEIGPGLAAITRPLLKRISHLHVIEIDNDIVSFLSQEFSQNQLTIHNTDALKVDLTAIPNGPHRIIGNLPYNISTPLLFKLLAQREHIVDMHFMLQREVIDRMASEAGNKTYGRLTVMLAPWCHVEKLFDVGPGAFKPAPKVWSSIVRITPYAEPLFDVGDEKIFASIVVKAFTARRKRLSNALGEYFNADHFAALELDPGLRPDQLTPEDYGRLSCLIKQDLPNKA